MSLIRNQAQLLSHGARELRRMAIDVVECALAAADPYRVVKGLIHLEDESLFIGDLHYDLSQRGKIYVLGAGKATFGIAQALEEILGSRIEGGVIAVNKRPPNHLQRIRVLEAGHPIPDQGSYQAAQEVMAYAQAARGGDLVFAAITGGSSALLCHPADDISLEEKKHVHQLLLASGADIRAINAVRKHLSKVKGGLLAQAILPAELINLTVSDVVGDPLDYITGPTVTDTCWVLDAVDVLKRYELWDQVAPSVREYLNSGSLAETPKALDERLVHTFLLVPSATACNGACARAQELGFKPLVLTTSLEGESRDDGMFLGAIAREIVDTARPIGPPCAVIASGEATVTLLDAKGSGGPSQELAVGAALKIKGMPQVVLASVDTDGFDGPTAYAGALIDGSTCVRAEKLGYAPFRQLRAHNTTPMLEDVGDVLLTGPTGTNIADLVVMLVGGGDGSDCESDSLDGRDEEADEMLDISLEKIKRESMAEKVVAALRSRILSGELQPGTRLVESRLAGQFGISRAPLREAFLILEREGLVVSIHNEGTFVADVSEDDLREIYLVRGVLEGLAMRLAADRITREQLDQLSNIVERMQEAASHNDAEQVVELDLEFHKLIWRLASCRRLYEILSNMIGPIRMFLALNTQVYDDLVDNVLEHAALLEVLSSGDMEKAQVMIIAHIEEAGERTIAYVQTTAEEEV